MMILSFINISKTSVIFAFVVLNLVINSICITDDYTAILEEQGNSIISCEKNKDENYILRIILPTDRVFLEKHFPVEPDIDNVNNHTYKITASTGVNSNYTFFVDVQNLNVSREYFNLLFYDENYVVYMENQTVFVADIFNESDVKASVARNYSLTAVSQSAVLSASIENDILILKYMEGENYEIVQEQITLDT